MEKIKVIYVVSGLGHSGSTLLNLILGTDKNSFSVSELKNLDHSFKKNNIYCDCGKTTLKCPVWKYVINNVEEKNLLDNRDTMIFQIKTFFKLLFGRNYHFSKFDDKTQYKYILEKARINKSTKVNCIVDSSKNLKRLMYLSSLKNLDLKVIFLTRDGRAVHNSWEKLFSLNPNKIWFRKLFHWMFKTYLINKFVNKNISNKNLIKLSYDNFAKNPDKYIQKINSKFNLSIDYNKLNKNINSQIYHNLGGNNMRKNKFKGIKYDQNWKKRMPKWKQWVLTVFCYIPNKKFVYNRNEN